MSHLQGLAKEYKEGGNPLGDANRALVPIIMAVVQVESDSLDPEYDPFASTDSHAPDEFRIAQW